MIEAWRQGTLGARSQVRSPVSWPVYEQWRKIYELDKIKDGCVSNETNRFTYGFLLRNLGLEQRVVLDRSGLGLLQLNFILRGRCRAALVGSRLVLPEQARFAERLRLKAPVAEENLVRDPLGRGCVYIGSSIGGEEDRLQAGGDSGRSLPRAHRG